MEVNMPNRYDNTNDPSVNSAEPPFGQQKKNLRRTPSKPNTDFTYRLADYLDVKIIKPGSGYIEHFYHSHLKKAKPAKKAQPKQKDPQKIYRLKSKTILSKLSKRLIKRFEKVRAWFQGNNAAVGKKGAPIILSKGPKHTPSINTSKSSKRRESNTNKANKIKQ